MFWSSAAAVTSALRNCGPCAEIERDVEAGDALHFVEGDARR